MSSRRGSPAVRKTHSARAARSRHDVEQARDARPVTIDAQTVMA